MSNGHLQEYISDVPMDIGMNFYPLPTVKVPDITIQMPRIMQYDFVSERKAIDEYEKDKFRFTPEPKSAILMPVTPLDAGLRKVRSEQILEPSPASPQVAPSRAAKANTPNSITSFEEFETKPSVFDLLEMHTIDDKAALEEVLLGTVSTPVKPTCSNVSDASVSQQLTLNIVNPSSPSVFPKKEFENPGSNVRQGTFGQAQPNGGNLLNGVGINERSLKFLTAKGYPESFVWQCARSLPVHLQPQIECYVKSVDALSKLGADSTCALDSLLRLNFKDEKRFASFVEAAVQLCALGFGVNAVIDALCVSGARRDAALERLLQN